MVRAAAKQNMSFVNMAPLSISRKSLIITNGLTDKFKPFLVRYTASKKPFLVRYTAPNFTKEIYDVILLSMKTNKKRLKSKAQRHIIEKTISPWKKLRAERRPPSGWLKTVRGALGINARQLAKRCGVHHSSILRIEKNEIQDKASIESLKKIASAMDCQLVYAIVPKEEYDSLEKIIDHRAELLAHKLIKKANHTMQLEAQGTSSKEIKTQTKKLANELKTRMDPRIWEKSLKYKKNK